MEIKIGKYPDVDTFSINVDSKRDPYPERLDLFYLEGKTCFDRNPSKLGGRWRQCYSLSSRVFIALWSHYLTLVISHT